MGLPVVIKTSGGMPVTVATSGYGLPMTVATNGFGIAVTQAANGLPVSGITFGPTLQLTGNSVLENSAVNTVVGTVSVTAGTTGTPTYTLTDNAGGKFKLVGNSLQVATATIDYETATFHGITVSVSGLTPTVSPAIFTVYVLDVDDTAPLITSSNTVSNAENSVLAHTLTANEPVTWAIVAPVTYATWDAATVTAVTLSGGNLVATNTGTTSADQGARVADAAGRTSGKYYFETTFDYIAPGGVNRGFGIGTTASTYTGMGNTGGVTGAHAYITGTVWSNGSSIFSWGAGWNAGQIMGIAVDLDNRRIWFRSAPAGIWNNNAANNPATNVGGLTIPAGTMVPFVTFGGTSGGVGNVLSANFGASAFSGAVPSGFTAGWTGAGSAGDNARFEISGNTLRWLGNGTKDFEAPNDANTDNAYIVTVRATDTASNVSATQTITVTVTDVAGAAVTAPVLLLTSGTTDNTPDFTLTGDLALADTVRFQYSTSSGFVGASEITNTIDSTEDAANVLNFSTGALANNTWYFRARIERPGTPEPGISAWSNTETITISVASFSTWNPADKYDVPAQTELQLSAGNLVITGCNFGVFTRCSVRSTTAKSAGKLYFEVTFNVYGNQPRLGLASISHPMVNDSFPGSSNAYGAFITGMYATDIVIVSNAGTVYNDPSWVPSPPVANGDVWGVAVDFATTTMWLRKNGTWLSGNPVTPTGGFNWVTPTTGLFIWAGINPAANPDNVLTLNTGGSAFATAIPSGFTAWG